MKTSQIAALLGLGVGALLIYLAFNSGERVIVGAMEGGRPIFGHILNKPMLAAGIGVAAASVIAFGLGFRGSSAGAGRTDAPGASGDRMPGPADEEMSAPGTETPDGPEAGKPGG